MRSLVRVVTSLESAARDASAIGAEIPARALMQRAGSAAAAEIALRYRDRLAGGVLVLAGPGNNGGDAWVVARALAAAGVRIRVVEPIPAKTDDARAERHLASLLLDPEDIQSGESAAIVDRRDALVVDGLLGTGAAGAPRGGIASAIDAANLLRHRGAIVVALDVPSGLDASAGGVAGVVIAADLTITFGTVKRGLLLARGLAGWIVAIDIGLLPDARDDRTPCLVDEWWVSERTPPIVANAHKGDRKKIAIVGGAGGMAGAAILAARSALRSGAGMVKLVVAPESLQAVQEAEPYALAAPWPSDDADVDHHLSTWADAVVIGPGLGRTDASRGVLDRILRCWRGPTVLDADALTLWERRSPELGAILDGRPALITPHAAEFARLAGMTTEEVLKEHFDIGIRMADSLRAAVLLKGVPTVITAPDGRRLVSASGTPALATAGSGDVLSGIAGVLFAQLGDPFVAGAIAAWIHGRAAERVPSPTRAGVRGIVLDDVVNELRDSWTFDARPHRYPVIAELPSLSAS